MKTIKESNIIPVIKECSVLVAGGGIAGIAAALAAAREGAKVVLVENSYILGGLATSGLITYYLPICDGMGRQVSFGICEELIRLSAKCFPQTYPDAWLDREDPEMRKVQRFRVDYNPQMFALNVEKLLLDAGVEILYGTRICNVQMEAEKIRFVITESKTGRMAIMVDSVVDCTGDADICKFAGEETILYQAGNVLAAWYDYISQGELKVKPLGAADIPEEERNGKQVKYLCTTRFTGLDGIENSEMVQLSHEQMRQDIAKMYESDDTFIPVTMPTIPQLRMTRHVDGVTAMDVSDEHTFCETSVGLISNWKRRGPIYEVPFACLHGSKVKNLICAGRCISTTEVMWDVTRVIGPCAVTGEAAGLAAAMTDDFVSLDIKKLQKKLQQNGVILHEKDL